MEIILVILSAIAIPVFYDLGKQKGRKECKKEFEETFDFEWVEVED